MAWIALACDRQPAGLRDRRQQKLAAGWNRFGVVLYDPVDGTVRRVLDRAARSGGGGRSVASL